MMYKYKRFRVEISNADHFLLYQPPLSLFSCIQLSPVANLDFNVDSGSQWALVRGQPIPLQ